MPEIKFSTHWLILQQIYIICINYTLNKVSKYKVIFSFLADKEENQMDRR